MVPKSPISNESEFTVTLFPIVVPSPIRTRFERMTTLVPKRTPFPISTSEDMKIGPTRSSLDFSHLATASGGGIARISLRLAQNAVHCSDDVGNVFVSKFRRERQAD